MNCSAQHRRKKTVLWYVDPETGWVKAEEENGNPRIPTGVFEYFIRHQDPVVEGTALVAFFWTIQPPIWIPWTKASYSNPSENPQKRRRWFLYHTGNPLWMWQMWYLRWKISPQYNAISGAPTAEEIISPPRGASPRGRGYIIRGSNGQNASFYRRSWRLPR